MIFNLGVNVICKLKATVQVVRHYNVKDRPDVQQLPEIILQINRLVPKAVFFVYCRY
jgi:hypothetical protein